MADNKTTKSSQRSLDSATKRENLVKQANAAQKAKAKATSTHASPKTSSETIANTSIVRDRSLEEQYLAKFQAQQKKNSAKQPAKAKVQQKQPAKVAPSPKAVTPAKSIIPKQNPTQPQNNGMQASDKERQKSFIIILLIILIILVLLLSGIFIFTNLNSTKIGTMKVEGSGVSWYLNGNEQTKFGISSGSELVADCQFDINIRLKKMTDEPINLRIEVIAYINKIEIPRAQVRLKDTSSALAQNLDYDYVYDDWSAPAGSYLNVCSGFSLYNVEGVSNDNFEIVITVYVS